MNAHIKTIIKGNEPKSAQALQNFIEEASQTFTFPELKNTQRKQLWEALFTLANSTKDETVLMNCFIAIRILSRDKTELNELITNDWLELSQTHSGLNDSNFVFDEGKLRVAIEVQKCLCNLVFNSSVAAGLCCKNGIVQQITERLKVAEERNIPEEVKFFDVKHIFLLTALRSEIRNKVRTDMGGIISLVKLLDGTLKRAVEKAAPEINPLDDQEADLVCEALKALFNLTLNCYGNTNDKEEDEQCSRLVVSLRMYLLMPISNPEKAVAIKNNVVNLLTNIPNDYYVNLMTPIQPEQSISSKFQFDGHNMTAIYEILMFLESQVADENGASRQYECLSPVVTVLLKGANSERAIRKYLRLLILPPLTDVRTRPEQGTTIRNHLCRLLTTPITQLRDLVAELLFVLCKKSVKRMIKYTGYGNAAGLFVQKGLLSGRSYAGEAEFSSDGEDSETEEYAALKHGINPVIGCYEEPHASPMENMTEEQKEYEAMKLVELIDNLTKCGVIQPCRVGPDGKPHPIEHVLQLQEGLRAQQVDVNSDSD